MTWAVGSAIGDASARAASDAAELQVAVDLSGQPANRTTVCERSGLQPARPAAWCYARKACTPGDTAPDWLRLPALGWHGQQISRHWNALLAIPLHCV
jgi:hypothetical protein